MAVDCGAIALPVDPAAYGLRVAVGAEAGQATGVLPLGRVAEPWARAVDADCARAEAARTVRVVSVAGEVDPTRPIVDLRFLLENDGPHVVEATPYGARSRTGRGRVRQPRPGPGDPAGGAGADDPGPLPEHGPAVGHRTP